MERPRERLAGPSELRRPRRRTEVWPGAREAHPGDARSATPAGYSNWTGTAAGARTRRHVWWFLRKHKIDLSGRKSWFESNDPEFVAKAADTVGLYVLPPDNAVVLSVDEKQSIQALERGKPVAAMYEPWGLTGPNLTP